MKKLYIVKTTRDFERIIAKKDSYANKTYVIYKEKNNLQYDRFGISVGKKIGNAVTRNLYKRRIRMIIDTYRKEKNNKNDYIVILRGNAKTSDFKRLSDDFISLMKKIEVENEN